MTVLLLPDDPRGLSGVAQYFTTPAKASPRPPAFAGKLGSRVEPPPALTERAPFDHHPVSK